MEGTPRGGEGQVEELGAGPRSVALGRGFILQPNTYDRARRAARRAQPFCGIDHFSEQELADDDAIRA